MKPVGAKLSFYKVPPLLDEVIAVGDLARGIHGLSMPDYAGEST